MSRQCPACSNPITIWRWSGPVVRYSRWPGLAGWFRFAPQHLHCRRCGVELRPKLLPIGYLVWALIIGLLTVAAFATLTARTWRGYAAIICVFGALPLSLIAARWGTGFDQITNEPAALSNNRWSGRESR
jgi:hypothetical protein